MTHGICKAVATTVFSAPAEETDVAEDMRTASQMQTSPRMQSPQVDGAAAPHACFSQCLYVPEGCVPIMQPRSTTALVALSG